MKAPLYSEIFDICQQIANASAQGDDEKRALACKNLQKLCATHQNTPKDHPLQWEALADFTEDGDMAMDIYDIALTSANKLALPTFSASIYLAMAQRQYEFEQAGEKSDKTFEYAKKAAIASKDIDDTELIAEIKDFIAIL